VKDQPAACQSSFVRAHRATKILGVLVLNVVAVVALMESFYAIVLRSPSILKYAHSAILDEVRHVYLHEDRNIIQFDQKCARYDPYLTYTLKPGHCLFSNREFATDVFINDVGTRDSDDASFKPEIVVLGDSFAMGWGVKQDETFAKLLEKKVGMKVLNAGISSYDTVREMRLFDRLDTSNVKYLILQYCDNDYAENVKFHKDKNYQIMSRQLYDLVVNMVAAKYENYTFGAYTGQALIRIGKRLAELRNDGFKNAFGGNSQKRNYNEEVGSFLYVLTDAGKKNLNNLKLIVFEANTAIHRHDDGFIKLLNERIKYREGKNFPKKIITKNFLTNLGEEDYYLLDEHLKPEAHLFIASQLAATILQEERTD
jgi:hypothetical protein